MQLVTPEIGLIFWTTLAFLILVLALKKLAWKPVLGAIHQREESIKKSLDAARQARQEVEEMTQENERILREARLERDTILKDARKAGESLLEIARAKAREEGDSLIEQAQKSITLEKEAAIAEMKSQMATIAVDIASKILEKELSASSEQEALVNQRINQWQMSSQLN